LLNFGSNSIGHLSLPRKRHSWVERLEEGSATKYYSLCDDDDDDDCPPELVTGSDIEEHKYHAETHDNDSQSDNESDGLSTSVASYRELSGNHGSDLVKEY